ncbi:MAG: hypothetical protein PHX87_05145 [Candidatus Peribacteraceae bacterium]|nr:hypothetical protein [Candidatus Peribacteraceae bacterium]MDD5742782.1 hypothetical protein [Candidatus Peribacteraceae bacterium]
MERPEDTTEQLYQDTMAGALARRTMYLGKGEISEMEKQQIAAATLKVLNMTGARAVDKLTTEELFRQRYPAWKGVKEIIATATDDMSFESGLILYRLPNGDWLEPVFGHYIPACFPWAQGLEGMLPHEPKDENPAENGQNPVTKLQTETARAANQKMHEPSR